MKSLRTPEEYFKNIPNFPFKPNYIEDLRGFEDLRLHYIDEGSEKSKEIFLCLHGQPTWAYLYRKMIPVFIKAGYRSIALDFFGFGKSDKPVEEKTYTFKFHRNTLVEFIERLDLRNITLVCQDWGGILGLTLPMDMPDRFSRLLIMNTVLATGDISLTQGFKDWRAWSNSRPDMEISRLIGRACPHLSPQELNAYDAPFPNIKYKAGVRQFPNIVPDKPNVDGAKISQKAHTYLTKKWNSDVFMAVGMQDPVFDLSTMKKLCNQINNCPEPYKIEDAGHFVQEWGTIVAKKALERFNL